jgi:hypothetical protein
MVTSPKRLGPDKDYAAEDQQHIQKADPSSRQRRRPEKHDRNCQRVMNVWSWAPNTKTDWLTDWLTDRQSQCDFDFTCAVEGSVVKC